jgi:hypothetical protein
LSAVPTPQALAWALAMDYDEIARGLARQAHYRFGVPRDDALQAARIGLYRAALEYDEAHGYYPPLAKRRAIDELRKLGAWRHHTASPPPVSSLDAPAPWGGCWIEGLVSCFPRPDAFVRLRGDLRFPVGLEAHQRRYELRGYLRLLGGHTTQAVLVTWGAESFGVSESMVGEDLRRMRELKQVHRQREHGRSGPWIYRLTEGL